MDSAEKFLMYIRSVRRYSPRTCAIYADIIKRYNEYSAPGETPETATPNSPATLTPDSIRNYEVHLMDEEKLDARTVNQHLSVISSYCKYLIKENLLQSNPVHAIKRPKQKKQLPEFYRDESIRQYFDDHRGTMEYATYEKQLNYIIISLLHGTAMRRSELIGLNNADLDCGRRILRVRGKGDKMREIPITQSLFEEISLYLQSKLTNGKCSDEPDDPLLQTAAGGRLYPVFVDRAVKQELGTVASITCRRSPHVLRHTLATELLDDGADLNSIKEFLGHSSLAATQVYTHISVEKLKNIYNNAHPRAKNGGKHGN